jgi:hypothetical protein
VLSYETRGQLEVIGYGVLCNYGLVEVDRSSKGGDVESKGYGMHSCVHSWTIHVLNQEWDSEMAGLVLECVGLHVPGNEAHTSVATYAACSQVLGVCS